MVKVESLNIVLIVDLVLSPVHFELKRLYFPQDKGQRLSYKDFSCTAKVAAVKRTLAAW